MVVMAFNMQRYHKKRTWKNRSHFEGIFYMAFLRQAKWKKRIETWVIHNGNKKVSLESYGNAKS